MAGHPQLNPLLYPDLSLNDSMVGLLATTGIVTLPARESPYVLGETIATTPGHVVFENPLCQLIHYPAAPATKRYKTPIFMIPPWINKFYILDLTAEKSLMAYLTKQGFDVFCLSWVNADQSFAHVSLTEFIDETILRSLRVIQTLQGAETVHGFGYCIGGVGLCLAALQHPKAFQTLTFMATPFDFSHMHHLNHYITPASLNYLKHLVKTEGVYHGQRLYQLFSYLKMDEMIYQDIIDRVYLKKHPLQIDYLHWNADSSNIPGQVHVDYLQDIYLPNKLHHQMAAHDTENPCPVFVVAADRDHIVPLNTSLAAFTMFKNLTFCLCTGGHVAGMIHDPYREGRNHYQMITDPNLLDQATPISGSWWHAFQQWLCDHSTEGDVSYTYSPIEAAPGRYVRQKSVPL